MSSLGEFWVAMFGFTSESDCQPSDSNWDGARTGAPQFQKRTVPRRIGLVKSQNGKGAALK